MVRDEVAAGTGLSQIARVVNVFVAPTETFADIRRSASWWLPFLLIALATLAVTVTIDRKVGFDQVVETQLRLNPSMEDRFAGLAPEQRAAQVHLMSSYYRYPSYASPLIVLAIAALGSLVLWPSLNFLLGGQATYGQIFCLWIFCQLPRLIAALVTAGTLLFGSAAESFDLREPIGTNIAYYIPDAAAWLRTLLSFADIIGLWVLALLIVGGAIVARVKIAQAAAVVIGWWLLIVLVSTAMTAAFS